MIDYVIGVDLGTGSTKALAINSKGKVIDSTQVHYYTVNSMHGYCEQAPELVWQAFIKCIHKIVGQHGDSPRAIILSSAMHSIMPVDGLGNPLQNMMIWADNRSSEIALRIRASAAGEMLYEQTGTPIHAMSPLCKIIWLKENSPEVFKAAHKFISIKEFIWFNLFNVFEVDHSIASASGLMDIENFTWSENALDLCGIDTDKLSTLIPTNFQRAVSDLQVCELLGLQPNTIFIAGASDGCLANLGSFAIEPGIAALTIGTSGAIRTASKTAIHNFEAMTFNYRLDENSFICGGPSNNGGGILKWYIENFLGKTLATSDDYNAVLKSLSETDAGADGLLFLPYLSGERAPIWNSEACGVFFGMRTNHTQPHFVRAVVEGISFALYDIAEQMLQGGSRINQIHVSGGFVKSSLWLQILADIFNKKICLINSDDASALGAGFLGLKTLKFIDDYNSLKPETIQEFLPLDANTKIYENKFKVYRELYLQLKSTMNSQMTNFLL